MQAYSFALTVGALACGGDALAQSTSTTMYMGGGITHAGTMWPSSAINSANCINMGGGIATCNTMDLSQPQRTNPPPDISRPQPSGPAGNFIGGLVAEHRGQSSQRKVKRMAAAGHCQGAANLSFAKEQFDMSSQIRRSCTPSPAPGETDTITVEQFVAGQALPRAGRAQPQGNQQLPVAFDLWCEGTELDTSMAEWKENNYRQHYRINLERGRYCDGDCATTQRLAKVDSYRITFYDNFGPTGEGSVKFINRENGELFEMALIGADRARSVSAKCESRPFSGFPEKQF